MGCNNGFALNVWQGVNTEILGEVSMKSIPKYCAFLLVAGFFSSEVLRGQDSDEDLFRQMLRKEQQLVDAIAAGDTAVWLDVLHEDCLIAVEDGKMLSRSEFVSGLRPLPAGFKGRITIIEPMFRRHENTLVVSFIDDEFLELFGQEIHTQYRQTNTWEKFAGRWQIIAMQLFEIPKNPPPVAVAKSVLAGYVGTYVLSEERKCVITVEGDSLFAQKSGRPKEALLAEADNTFFWKNDGRVRVMFMKDDGERFRMIERRAGEDVVWKKEP